MTKEQQRNTSLCLVCNYGATGVKPKPSAKSKTASKAVEKCLLQFDHLNLIRGVFHHLCITDILLIILLNIIDWYYQRYTAVLQKIDNDCGH